MKPSYPRSTRILQAASRLMAYYGFDKTSMDDIAREAGVSKGALYLEWPGKDALFDALLNFEMGRLLADLRERVERDPQGGQLARLYGHTLLALKANPLIAALYTRDSRVLGDFVHRQDPRRYTERLLLGKDVIAGMQAAGQLRADIPPEVMAYLFAMIALGFASIGSLVPAGEAPPLETVVDGLAALVERGLGAGGGEVGKEGWLKMIDKMREQASTLTPGPSP